jgi:urea carboxylase
MEKLKTLLVANRGEIAARIIRTSKGLNIRTIAIYTEADAASAHVAAADEAILLTGPESKAYLDGEQIVEIAKAQQAECIIPGYGFLSENTEFAGQVAAAGMVFAGPSAECIEAFGIKHTARELATKADVPVVPGTRGLVKSEDEAVEEAKKLGFPVSHCADVMTAC